MSQYLVIWLLYSKIEALASRACGEYDTTAAAATVRVDLEQLTRLAHLLSAQIVKVPCDLLVSTGSVAFAVAYDSSISKYLDSPHGKRSP